MEEHKKKIQERRKLRNFKTDKIEDIHVPHSDSINEKGWELYGSWQQYADNWMVTSKKSAWNREIVNEAHEELVQKEQKEMEEMMRKQQE